MALDLSNSNTAYSSFNVVHRDQVNITNVSMGRTHPGESRIENDADGKIWSIYMLEAEEHDRALVERWKESMNGLLIFAGLFSATLTTFITQSYKRLQQDPQQVLLLQISNQLGALLNETRGVSSSPQLITPFTPTFSTLRVNACWFLSLGSAVACALSATLVDQWARNYLQAIQRPRAAYKRARIRSHLFDGIKAFRAPSVVAAIPTLMHASVFLFFAGLFDFMLPINKLIAFITLGILVACAGLYGLASVFPIMTHRSPYRTPLSSSLWRVWGKFRRGRPAEGGDIPLNLSKARDRFAVSSSLSEDRMFDALCWTLTSLTDDVEIEPFIEGIPGFMTPQSKADCPKSIQAMKALIRNKEVKLGDRIISLLKTCQQPDPISSTLLEKRAVTCMDAIGCLMKEMVWEPSYDESGTKAALRLVTSFIRLDASKPNVVMHCAMRTVTMIVHQLLYGFADILSQLKREEGLQPNKLEVLLPEAERKARLALLGMQWVANWAREDDFLAPFAVEKVEAVRRFLDHHYHRLASTLARMGAVAAATGLPSPSSLNIPDAKTASSLMVPPDEDTATKMLLSLQGPVLEARFALLFSYIMALGTPIAGASRSRETIYNIVPEELSPRPETQLRLVNVIEGLIKRKSSTRPLTPLASAPDEEREEDDLLLAINPILDLVGQLNHPDAIEKADHVITQHLLRPPTHEKAKVALDSLRKRSSRTAPISRPVSRRIRRPGLLTGSQILRSSLTDTQTLSSAVPHSAAPHSAAPSLFPLSERDPISDSGPHLPRVSTSASDSQIPKTNEISAGPSQSGERNDPIKQTDDSAANSLAPGSADNRGSVRSESC